MRTQAEYLGVSVESFWDHMIHLETYQHNQTTQPVVIHNSSQALLTASTLRHCQIGGVSAQDQTRWVDLELFLDIETRHRTESFFCFVFVVIAAHCSIVELIVRPSRARQHASSCVWNRGRLFINKPRTRGFGLRGRADGLQGGDKDGLSKIGGHLVEWGGECENNQTIGGWYMRPVVCLEQDIKLSCCCRRSSNGLLLGACGKFRVFVCWCNSAGWFTRVRTVRDVDMKVKRAFLAAMFCCCISISKLLQMRSVDDPRLNIFLSVTGYFKMYF